MNTLMKDNYLRKCELKISGKIFFFPESNLRVRELSLFSVKDWHGSVDFPKWSAYGTIYLNLNDNINQGSMDINTV